MVLIATAAISWIVNCWNRSYENRAINRSGDINNDGEINTVDYNLLMSYVDPCIPSDKYAVSQYFCYVIDK